MLARLLNQSAATFDRAVSLAITGRSASSRARSRSESLGHAERMRALSAIRELYAPRLADVDGFFGRPEARTLVVESQGTRSTRGGTFARTDVRFESRVEPTVGDLRDSFLATRENHTAAARLFRGRGEGRPVALLVHGYRAGQYAIEERVWPVDWLLDHGLDVALFVLPFHAVRATPGRGPRFPASDPRFTIEAFRQAIGDLRDLAATFRKDGAPGVIAMGMSLGGYTTSLLATVEPLDFAAPIIPLASFADIARDAGRLVGSPEEQILQHAAVEAAHEIASPFTRRPALDKRRVIVAAGEGDRITPLEHSRKLAAHFEADLLTFAGGHILQFWRRAVFKAIGARLRELGIFSERERRG